MLTASGTLSDSESSAGSWNFTLVATLSIDVNGDLLGTTTDGDSFAWFRQ